MPLSAQKIAGFDVNADGCSGLTFAVRGGMLFGSAGYRPVLPQKVTLAPNATNYIEVDNAGVVSENPTAFTDGRNFLYIATTDANFVTELQDWRFNPGVYHPLGQSAKVAVGQAPSATSALSINASLLAADASSAATGDVYVSSAILYIK